MNNTIEVMKQALEALEIAATGDIGWSRKYVEALAAFEQFNGETE